MILFTKYIKLIINMLNYRNVGSIIFFYVTQASRLGPDLAFQAIYKVTQALSINLIFTVY